MCANIHRLRETGTERDLNRRGRNTERLNGERLRGKHMTQRDRETKSQWNRETQRERQRNRGKENETATEE